MIQNHPQAHDNSKQINVACFIQGLTTPSSRFRILQLIPYLEKYGINCTLFPAKYISKGGFAPRFARWRFHKGFRRLTQVLVYFPLRLIQILRADLSKFNVVIVQKSLMDWPDSRILERLIAQKNKIIFDIDDAEFASITRGINKTSQYIDEIAAVSQVVITGNQYLKNSFKGKCSKVFVLPTTVNEHRFYPKNKSAKDIPCIGWTGTSSNFRYLFELIPVFEILAEKLKVKFCIISNMDYIDELSHLPNIKFIKWDEECEVAQLHNIDIGVMPLRDDLWTRGKCAFKLIQYQAVGIPSVVSRVGANKEVQQEGATGYFAETRDDWVEKLTVLVNNPMLRKTMGDTARKNFMETFSIDRNVLEITRIISGFSDG